MENSRRQKIAEIVANQLFVEQFGWVLRGTANIDWACINPTAHGRKPESRLSHPTDACFRYVDPYDGIPVYVVIDFKSYGETSITKSNIEDYVRKLAEVVRCAPTSESFQRIFCADDTDYNVHGLLFVYNHDNEYNKDFSAILDELSVLSANIAKDQLILIMGPDDVRFHDMMCRDMREQRAIFKDLSNVRYYAPDLKTEKVKGKTFGPLTLRMLSSPWVLVCAEGDQANTHVGNFVVYYRDTGESQDEFLWLIDSLIDLRLLGDENTIQIRGILPHAEASIRFHEARTRYKEEYHGVNELSKTEFSKRLDRITFISVNTAYSRFSEHEIGLD